MEPRLVALEEAAGEQIVGLRSSFVGLVNAGDVAGRKNRRQ